MKAQDLVEFATRERASVADLKASHWRDLKRTRGPGIGLQISEELRQHILARRPDWPNEAYERNDLDVHVRVGKALRSVTALGAR